MMIEIQNVTYRYGGENTGGGSINDINLKINDGETVVICGQSGCGKTTLTRLINGLIPHYYEGEFEGRVLIGDYDVSANELADTSALVGSVFQNPKSQFFNVDTTGELTFGCENMQMSREDIGKRLDITVKDMKLEKLLNRNIFELSGGEKQQVACGSVYATNPSIYVMDEPSSNLDKKAIRRLALILKKLKSEGKTIILSEHRLHYLMDIADRFIYMKDGRIVREFTSEELNAASDEELKELGLRSTSIERMKLSGNGNREGGTPSLEVVDLICNRQNSRILDIDRIILPRHSVVAVIGDNGCGKSTLAQALCGVLDCSGSIAFDGEYLNDKQRQKKSFLVMQDVNRQLFMDSVLEEIMLNTSVSEEKARAVLARLGLEGLEERHPASLSGGQKQRVAIAAALCANKDILIYDEPTSGLDRIGMEQFGELLNSTGSDVSMSMIITHDPELIMHCCTHVLHIERGRVIGFYPLNHDSINRVKGYFLAPSEESTSKKRDKRSSIGKILDSAGRHKYKIFMAAALMFLGAAASVVPFGVVGKLVKDIIEGSEVTLKGSMPLLLVCLISELVYAVFYMAGLITSHGAAFGTLENLRCKLQSRFEAQSLGAVAEKGTGEIKKLFTEDVESIEMLLAHMIPEGMANLAVPVVALMVLIYINWELAFLTIIMLIIGLSISNQMYSAGMDRMGSYYASAKRMNNAIVEYVNGMEVVRVFNRQKESGLKYAKAVKDYRDFALDWYKVSWPWMALYKSTFSGVVLFSLPFGAVFVINGSLGIADYIMALMISFGVGPLLLHCMAFIGAIPQVSYKIQSLDAATDVPPLKTGTQDFCGSDNSISFRDVHFAYKDLEIIKGISFEAKEGDVTALVGMSGSGKTTVAKLMAHYYDLMSGSICIGGQDITDMTLEALNSRISFVSQNNFLFNKTIMENIRMGRPGATDDEVINAAVKAECADFIRELPEGFDTVAGKAGGALSGGQRQRISFAAAILKDAPIIILDEATAFVDAENERRMRKAINEITRGKTVIVIAHKLRSIMDSDKIIVLDNGRISGQGKHSELLQTCDTYAKLWEMNSRTSGWKLGRMEENV